jgi:hypothetical protein
MSLISIAESALGVSYRPFHPGNAGINVPKAAGVLVFASRLARCFSGEASSQKLAFSVDKK